MVERQKARGLGRGAGQGLGGGAGGAQAVEEQGEALEDGDGEQDLGRCQEEWERLRKCEEHAVNKG